MTGAKTVNPLGIGSYLGTILVRILCDYGVFRLLSLSGKRKGIEEKARGGWENVVACMFLVAEKTYKRKEENLPIRGICGRTPDNHRNLISATNCDGKLLYLCACKLAKKDRIASITITRVRATRIKENRTGMRFGRSVTPLLPPAVVVLARVLAPTDNRTETR
jgi:hypothetical protein